MKVPLEPRTTPQALADKTANRWRLQIPGGPAGHYRLAQLDDYGTLNRSNFAYKDRASLRLKCRVSSNSQAGTWGFGFWNDPFAFSLGLQGGTQRLPALPNACWFFNASPENHLAFRDHLPGHGFLAQSFRSPKIPAVFYPAALLAAPLLLSKYLSRILRRLSGSIIQQDGRALEVDATQWHTYHLVWNSGSVVFSMDNQVVYETVIAPRGPLGTVIWMDNQFAAWMPSGKMGMGTLSENQPGWLELEDINVQVE